MFDSNPSTSNVLVTGANNVSSVTSAKLRKILWIGNVWDPDVHDPADFDAYVVPEEGWLVWDLQGTEVVMWFVYKVYQNKSELKPCTIQQQTSNTTEDQDVLFGRKGGPIAGEGLMVIDYTTRPNRARIDSKITRPGAAYALLYLGDRLDTDDGGVIISAQYDKNGVKVSNKIPVTLAAIKNYENRTVMTTDTFSVIKNEDALPNGSRATLVFFDEGDMPITPSQRIVIQHCGYLRNRQIGVRYVTDIELLGPWFTDANAPDKMILPILTPLSGIEFRAAVHYSDGEPVIRSVNDGKFELIGTDEYRPTYPGQAAELVLRYIFDEDEEHYVAKPGQDGRLTRKYIIMAGDAQGAYAVKLYIYPVWDFTASQWKLVMFMYDLDRRTFINVTDHIRYSDVSPPFRPNSYGMMQDLTFLLTLKDVSQTYNSTIYKQETGVVLYNDINSAEREWGVVYDITKPTYDGKFANTVNNGANTKVNVKNGAADQAAWLEMLYWSVIPSFDIFNEEQAPTPDKFYLMLEDGRKWPVQIADWDKDITIGGALPKGQTVFLQWVKVMTGGDEQQLALTGLSVKV